MTLLARYVSPKIPTWVLPVLASAFALLTTLRGIGWMNAESGRTVATVVMDALLNPFWWGLGLTVGGGLLVSAYIVRVHFFIWAAHGHLLALYTCIAITTIQSTIAFGGGWQHVAAPLGGAIWHGLLCWLTKPLPRGSRAD